MCPMGGTPSTQPGVENWGDHKGGHSAEPIQSRPGLSSVLLWSGEGQTTHLSPPHMADEDMGLRNPQAHQRATPSPRKQLATCLGLRSSLCVCQKLSSVCTNLHPALASLLPQAPAERLHLQAG